MPEHCENCHRILSEDGIFFPAGARLLPDQEGQERRYRCLEPCLVVSAPEIRPDQEPMTMEWECPGCGEQQEAPATVTRRGPGWKPEEVRVVCQVCRLPLTIPLAQETKP